MHVRKRIKMLPGCQHVTKVSAFAIQGLEVAKEFCLILMEVGDNARTYLQLPLRQWGAGNVYLLVLSSWKVNIAENPIAIMGL